MWKQWQMFILGGSKITADGDCSHEIKRRLLLGRKAMTNLDGVWKSRDITLPTKVHLIKARVFPVVIYGYESWIIMKVKCWRIDAFELWCWRRHLKVPWTARRSNQSILKISPGCSLEGLMLRLKLQYFGHLMWRAKSLEKTLMLRKIEGQSIGASFSASILPMNFQSWFPLGLTGLISLQSIGLSRVFSNTIIQKHQFFSAQPS